MGRRKTIVKAKEPIRLRFKKLKNGNKSIYLMAYDASKGVNNCYSYEHLGLYLVPEVDEAARILNKNTMNAANAIKAQRLIDYANGKAGIKKPDKGKKILLMDWMKLYAAKKEKLGQSKSNAVTIKNVMLHLVKYKGDKITMDRVDKAFCEGFVLYLVNGKTIGTRKPKKSGEHKEKPIANSTARLYFNTFVTALNEAVRDGIIGRNPANQLKKEEKKPLNRSGNDRGYLEIDEVKKLMNTPCNDEQTKMAFLFACFCGLRLSDIKDLKWKDIKSGEDGTVVSKIQVKTQQSIIVPLSANALEWLPDRGEAKGEDLVFTLPSHFSINRSVKKWARDAEIEKNVTFHCRSHSKIFYLLNISELSTLKNVTDNDLETSYILFLSQLCNIQRTL